MKYIVVIMLSYWWPDTCPNANTRPQFTTCAAMHMKWVNETIDTSFTDRDKAYSFYNKATTEFNKRVFGETKVKIEIDSVAN